MARVVEVTNPDTGQSYRLRVRPVPAEQLDAIADAHPVQDGDPGGYDLDAAAPAILAAGTGGELSEADAAWLWEHMGDVGDAMLAAILELSRPAGVEGYLRRIARDERFALELAYCAPLGIPHSTFLAWPFPDQAKALAWHLDHADRCPGCGVRGAAMQDPSAGEVHQRECVHCANLKAVNDSVPAERRADVHTWATSTRPDLDPEG